MIRVSQLSALVSLALIPLLPGVVLSQSTAPTGTGTDANQSIPGFNTPTANPPTSTFPATPPSIVNPVPPSTVPSVIAPATNQGISGQNVPTLSPPSSSFPSTPASTVAPGDSDATLNQPDAATNRAVIQNGVLVPGNGQTATPGAVNNGTGNRTGSGNRVPTTNQPAQTPPTISTTGFTRTAISGQLAGNPASRLDSQLLQATCSQNWRGAIAIVDQAITSAPASQTAYRSQLRQYRSRLQDLASAGTAIPNWSQQCTRG